MLIYGNTSPRDLKIKKWPKMPETLKKLRVVDLYSGCGGLTLGAMQAAIQLSVKLEIALALDVSRPALDVYRKNFSNLTENILIDDISNYSSDSSFTKLSSKGKFLLKDIQNINILMAGPPCQGNSNLNNSSRRNDPRNELYLAPILFAEKILPELIIIENVPAVIHSQSNVVSRAITRLNKMGYSCSEFRADLTSLGLPQTRKRHLLIASRIHSNEYLANLLSTIPSQAKNIPLSTYIADLADKAEASTNIFTAASRPSIRNIQRINYLFDQDIFDLPDFLRPACHRDKKHSYISMYGRLRNDSPAQTITSGFGSMGQGRYVHPTRRRTITPHEAARIQGFPDYFSFNAASKVTELRQMIGNAVAPAISYLIISKLMNN